MSIEQPITAIETRFTANGQSVGGFLARPENTESAPALILIQEWWGLNDHIKDIAKRYARAGFITAAVDLYDGKVTKDATEASAMMSNLSPTDALTKIKTTLESLRDLPGVTNIGVTGFCMGGLYTVVTACKLAVDAAVAFYGMPDDLSIVADLNCPILFFGGAKDQWITVEKMNRLKDAFQQYGKDGEVQIYSDADHAFFNDTRPEVYHAADAQDAWKRALEFLHRQLQ